MAVPPRQHAVSHLQARYQRAPPAPLPLPADEPCRPWLCPVGALAGQYLTAELEEVQKADFARKMSSIMGKGTVDARALDPRPVVRARLFTCDPNGGNRVEIEPDPDTKELTAFNGQLICKAGLYPYNRDFERDGDLTRFAGGRVTPSPLLPSSAPPQAELASEFAYPPATLARAPARPLGPHCEMAYALSGMRDLRARECQAYHEPVGKVALYFVFEDLRVSEVGHFVLKYSLIFLDNAFVARPDIKPPVLAKCWGGVFAIYPSKKAPPKEKSTDFGMFLYTNNLLSRPHTEKPANKRKAAQAEKEKEREKAAAHSLSSAHPSHPSHPQHPAQSSSIFHPFPPPSGLGAGPSIAMDPFQGQGQGQGSRQPQPPSYTFPFPPGAFPHAPGRDEGPLPRITVDSIRRAEAGGSGVRREEEESRREEVSPRAREQEVRARGQPESSVRGRGYTDEPMRDDFVDERERYSPRRRQGADESPRRRQDDESPRRRQERDDNSPRRRSASPRRSPPRTAANGQRVPTPPRRASPPPRRPTPDEPLPRPSALPAPSALPSAPTPTPASNASRTSANASHMSTDRAPTSFNRAPPSADRAPTSAAPTPSAPTPSAPTPTPTRAAGTKPAAVSAAELRAQELEGIALAQARHEAWLRAQYDPPPAPAPVDIPPDVLAAAAALADDGGSEGSGPSGGALEDVGEGKEGVGVLRVVARDREREKEDERERVVVERRRLKFDPVRDS